MSLEIDLHGLTIEESKKILQRFIIDNPDCSILEVIHGYNNGSKLKDFLSNPKNIQSRRVIRTTPDPFNKGRTLVYLNRCLV